MQKKTAKAKLFDQFADDLVVERAARPLVIVGASKVDGLLLDILSAYLLPKRARSRDSDELLEGDRPLSTFSARIKICYRLGLVDQTLYLALEALRTLRNASAHAMSFDVGKSPTREHIAELRNRIVGRESFTLTKTRYFDPSSFGAEEELQCLLLTLCVLLEAIRERIRTTKGHRTALRIAKR